MNFRNLDLNLLKVFDAVMAERNLTRAAERLAMTPPPASPTAPDRRVLPGSASPPTQPGSPGTVVRP